MQACRSQFLLIICCLLPLGLLAQQTTPDSSFIKNLQKKLDNYIGSRPFEQIYVHTDRPYYAAGEDIWFKAYLTSGLLHTPPGISKMINVVLVNADNGHEVDAVKLPVASGTAAGDFHLPYTLPAGNYRLKAYTGYILQADPKSVFLVNLVIANPAGTPPTKHAVEKQVASAAPVTAEYAKNNMADEADVQFMPEGGTIVNNINSKIGFKVIGADGRGTEVSGRLFDDKDSLITGFKSAHLGMGSFILFPQPGRHYHVVLAFSDNSHKAFQLPAASPSGYVLTLYRKPDAKSVVFRVSVNHPEGVDGAAPENLFVVASAAGKIRYATKINMVGSIVTGVVAVDKFPDGVAQLTLFKQSGEPLCERLFFVNNHDQLQITLADSITGKRAGQQSRIVLRASTPDGKPVFSSLSVAVIDDHIAPDADAADRDNILSHLLLSSNLTGEVETPGYYFANDNEDSRNALDALMLTQGYRHFEWKTVLNTPDTRPAFTPVNGITLSGRITTASGKPVPNGKVTMYGKTVNWLIDTVADNEGRFTFGPLALQDTLRVILTAAKPDGGTDVLISVTQDAATVNALAPMPIAAKDTTLLPANFKQNAFEAYRLSGKNKSVMLNQVDVRSVKKANKVGEYSANLNGPGNADQVITFDDPAMMAPDLGTMLAGRIAGVRVNNGYAISNRAGSFMLNTSMLVIYDGAYMTTGIRNMGPLSMINPQDVETVEVLKNGAYTAIYGSRGANGVLIITSKHGKPAGTERSPNVVAVTLHGFYRAREFYVPKYGAKNGVQPDLYATVFWKPDVMTDKDGKASFEFLNGGNAGVYRVIVQGFDTDGRLGYQVFKYRVE